jgi:Rhodanese-related sulfurtransferase
MKGLPVKKLVATFALIAGATLSLAGCASAEPVEITADTVIIDVRTPGEFASGHLEGAVNIDIQSPDFAAQVMELDKDGEYFIYCRSGNRSGQAISQMDKMGFTDMTNGGGVQQASDISGIDVVTP